MSEKTYVETMINLFGKEGKMFAMVGDTYNIFEFCEMIGTDPDIRADIIANGEKGGFTIVRPDSGDPVQVVNDCLKILDKHYGHIMNSKGFRVLNNVRIIQGDGINHQIIRAILTVMEMNGYSADNVAFGQGGALLQQINRDTLEFAMKCSAVMINGKWMDVYKDPITSTLKKSKKGRLMLNIDKNSKFVTNVLDNCSSDYLITRYIDGKLYNETNFDKVRIKSKENVR